ncbi:hypothetical protein MD484_g8664, partial [Candolleomyces efflorescens]
MKKWLEGGLLPAIDRFRTSRSTPSQEPHRWINLERQLWDLLGLNGPLDQTRLLQEVQMRAQTGDRTAQLWMPSVHYYHTNRHEEPNDRWPLPFNHEYWKKLPRAPLVRLQPASPPRLWALLIGNHEYTTSHGSPPIVAHARNVTWAWRSYLVNVLRVPDAKIKHCKNLTRYAMLQALYDLRDKKEPFNGIEAGDHVLFVYSGRARSCDAKRSSFEKGYEYRIGSIEALCPVDADALDKSIWDRELLLILSDIHNKTKANITLILDCNFAGGFSKVKAPSPSDTTPLPPTSEQGDDAERQSAIRSPTWAIDMPDMYRPVLLAACQDTEFAHAEDGQGIFTSAVMHVLQLEKARGLTYSGLIKAISPLRHDQNPRFDGDDGILFGIQDYT